LPGGATDVLPGNVVPDPVVDALSIWAYDGRKRQLQKEGKVSDDPQYVEPVTRVFEHIKQAAAQSTYGETAEAFEWEVLVVEDELAYVSVLPGGKVFVHTGIFDLAKNEAGLAAVLGHEAIHALDRHAAQRFTRDLVASLPIGAILTGTAADPDTFDPKLTVPVMAALGMGVYAGVHQPFSRELESEADYGGLLLAASAGYEPEEALVFWIQLVERHEAEYYDTHPASEQRIKDLQDSMDKFQAAYNEAKSKRRPAPLPEFPMTG
jgi:predicted Zn-dependent protease